MWRPDLISNSVWHWLKWCWVYNWCRWNEFWVILSFSLWSVVRRTLSVGFGIGDRDMIRELHACTWLPIKIILNLNICVSLNNQFSFEINFHLERCVTLVTKCILLMSAQQCFLEQVNLHFADWNGVLNDCSIKFFNTFYCVRLFTL